MCVFIIRLKMFLFFLGRDQVTLNPPSVIGSSPRLLGPSQCFFFNLFFLCLVFIHQPAFNR